MMQGPVVMNRLFFVAFAPFVGGAIGVYLFGKVSMAHFN
jgi:hypothetical protein